MRTTIFASIVTFFVTYWSICAVAQNKRISDLPLRAASGTSGTAAFPYIDPTISDPTQQTGKIYLSDIINLPSLQSALTSLIPVQGGHSGQCLQTNGFTTNWGVCVSGSLTTLTQDVSASGSGSVPATVQGIQGVPVASTAPTSAQLLSYNSTAANWTPINGVSGTVGALQMSDGSGAFSSDELWIDNVNHGLQVGSIGPGVLSGLPYIYVGGTGSPGSAIVSETNGSGTSASDFVGRRSRGTPLSPTAVQSGDNLANFNGNGYDGSAYPSISPAGISLFAQENWTPTASGEAIGFYTTTNGTFNNRLQRMLIDNKGQVLIGLNSIPSGANSQFSVTAQATDKRVWRWASNTAIGSNFGGLTIYARHTVDTTPATVLLNVPAGSSAAELHRLRVIAYQTGGATGSVGDGARFIFNVSDLWLSSTMNLLDTQNPYSYTIDAGITVTFAVSSNQIQITLTGVTGRNLDWYVYDENDSVS